MKRRELFGALWVMSNGLTLAQASVDSVRSDGGSVQAPMSGGEIWNRESALKRVWHTLNDSACPIRLEPGGVTVKYFPKSYGGEFHYAAQMSLMANAAVAAVEIVYILFDAWGTRLQTLGFQRMMSMQELGTITLSSTWLAYEPEARMYRTSVAFVSKVLLADEAQWRHNEAETLAALSKIKLQINKEAFRPDPPRGKLV